MLAARTAHPGLLAPAAGLGVAAGLAAATKPGVAISLTAICVVVIVATRISPQALVLGAIAYLPFEGFAASHVHGPALPWIRYGPEAVLAVVGLTVLVAGLGRMGTDLRRMVLAIIATLTIWGMSAVSNGVGLTTYLLGIRAEFRYVPLLLIMALSTHPRRDARTLGRLVVAVAGIQAIIAAAELIGGAAVRTLFAQHYSVDVGGITVAHSTAVKLTSITGTMRTYNELSALLVLGTAVLIAAGPRRLGIPPRLGMALGVLMPAMVVASGSREGTLGVGIVLAVAARTKLRVPVLRIVAVAAVLTAVALPWIVVAPTPGHHSAAVTSRVREKWTQLLSPATWSGQYNVRNFRLYLSATEIRRVANDAPVFGFGTGSIVDPRTIGNRSNPLLEFVAGRLALERGFVYDGNWSLLLMETGFLGLASMFALFAVMIAAGRWLADGHWIGQWLIMATLVVVELGFFAPILQQHAASAVLWALTGTALAMCRELRGRRRPASTL